MKATFHILRTARCRKPMTYLRPSLARNMGGGPASRTPTPITIRAQDAEGALRIFFTSKLNQMRYPDAVAREA